MTERLQRWFNSLRLWLNVGIGIKRWLLVLAFATLLAGVGALYLAIELRQQGIISMRTYQLLTMSFLPDWLRIVLFLTIGGGLLFFSLVRLGISLIAPFRQPGEDVAEILVRYQRRNRGPRIVAIGGGTGMPGLLRGLKQHTSNITAIVTVADDGGSSGRLRREYGLLPPGDFRNNIAALAKDESLMTQLMQFRFGESVANGSRGGETKSELSGHAFGNLVIAALVGITGSFDDALLNIDRVLAMRGTVMPSTLQEVQLHADVIAGGVTQRVVGESAIPKAAGRIDRVMLEPARVRAYPPAIRAILRADLVVMGPGSLYTSVLPNLLVQDLARALVATTAKKVYVCNVAQQPGETDGFTVSDHFAALVKHCSAECIDYVLANDNMQPAPQTGGGATVFVALDEVESAELITADLVDEARPWRHDSQKVADVVMKLLTG